MQMDELCYVCTYIYINMYNTDSIHYNIENIMKMYEELDIFSE